MAPNQKVYVEKCQRGNFSALPPLLFDEIFFFKEDLFSAKQGLLDKVLGAFINVNMENSHLSIYIGAFLIHQIILLTTIKKLNNAAFFNPIR